MLREKFQENVTRITPATNHDGDAAAEKSLEYKFALLHFFTIISIRSTCTLWPNYAVKEQVGKALKLRQKKGNLPP